MWKSTVFLWVLLLGSMSVYAQVPDFLKAPDFHKYDDKTEIYTPKLTLTLDELYGSCNETLVNKGEYGAILQCVGEAFNPSIPNPLMIIDPIRGDNLDYKLSQVQLLPVDSNGGLDWSFFDLNNIGISIINIPLLLLSSFIEIAFNAIKFLIVFAVRFFFVYMFYISLGFQAIMRRLDSNYELSSKSKLEVTTAFMVVASIIFIGNGGGWLT